MDGSAKVEPEPQGTDDWEPAPQAPAEAEPVAAAAANDAPKLPKPAAPAPHDDGPDVPLKPAPPPPQAGPPTAAPAKGSSCGYICGYYDVALVGRLQDDLLRGLARAALKKVEGNPFKSPKDVAPAVQAELAAFLQKQCAEAAGKGGAERRGSRQADAEDGEPECLPRLVTAEWLATFSDAKRNVFGKVTAVFTDEDTARLLGVAQQLQHDNVWPSPQREELTLQLIRTLDPAGKDHCRQECSTAEALASHKACCPIRPISCPFPGCPDTFKASYFLIHDTRCPYKPVPCIQGCPEQVPRREMDAHCTGPCSHRVVTCPFQSAGCGATVLQGEYAEHIQRFQLQHLEKVYTVVCDQGSRLQQQGQHMADVITSVNTASKGTNQAINALRTEVLDEHKATEKKVAALHKEASDHKKEIAELKKAIADLRKETGELRKENAALKKPQAPRA